MDVREQAIAESNGLQANKYGLVLCKVLVAFGPYSKDDLAGFAPGQTVGLAKQGLVEPQAAPAESDEIDEDTRVSMRSRMMRDQALGFSEASIVESMRTSTGYGAGSPDPQTMTTDTGPDPRVQDFRRNGVSDDEMRGVPESRRRPIREIEQRPNSAPLSPAGASLSGKPMAITGVTATAGEPVTDPDNVTDMNRNGGGSDDGVHIPDGIEDAHANTRKSLASQIAGRKIETAPEADQIIADERAKRAGETF